MYALTRFSLEHPRLCGALLLLITIGLAAGLPRLQHAYGYTAIIGSDHPVIETLNDMVDQFGGGIPARIRWACGDGQACGSVFDRASLEMAAALTSKLGSLDEVRDVYGIANSGLLVPEPSGFSVRHFVEHGIPVANAEELAGFALRDPSWLGSLVSSDLKAGTIFVVPDDSGHRSERALVEAIDEALAAYRSQGFEFYLAGGPIDGFVAGRDLSESTSRVIPVTVLLIALVLFALYRSWQDVAVSLVCMGIALLWTYGLLGWLGWPQDGLLEVLAPLLMVVGVCDAVHMLAHSAEPGARDRLAMPADTRARLLAAAQDVGGPCFITTATTAAAFMSFTVSGLAGFQRFGAISAFGVVACLLLSFALLPILAERLPRRNAARDRRLRAQRAWVAALNALLRLPERHCFAVLSASSALLLLGGLGWYSGLRVDTDWASTLGEESNIVQAKRFDERQRFAINELEIELTLPRSAPVEAPETLARIEAFENAAAGLPSVLGTKSVLALISQLNRLLHDNDPAFERVGDSLAANAEILELIGFDDPDMLGIWLNLDRTRLRITTNNREGSAQQQGELLRAIGAIAKKHLGPDWGIRLSGNAAVEYAWTNEVQMTQIRSFPIALALVFAIVSCFLRSPGLALVALIPAVLPIVVTLGAMGWAGMNLDMGRAMIAAILLGIAVDDSIHILSRYRLCRIAGLDPRAAIRNAVLHVGRAIVTTSLSLSLGFLALTASAWQSISSFGLFVSLAIGVALVAALVVLPAVIVACGPILSRADSWREHRGQRSPMISGALNGRP